MVDGIRRFKGVKPPKAPSSAQTISIDGDFSDWLNVWPKFKDTRGDVLHRDCDGYGNIGLRYTNTTGRNDFINMKVARDDAYVYFYAETDASITPCTDSAWMLLFIDADQNQATGWEGYDYLVNYHVNSANSTTLMHTSGGWNWTMINSNIAMAINGNKLELAIPRADIGQGSGSEDVVFDFHWADNIQKNDDIIEFSVSGDSAPNRRFNYRYDTSFSAKACALGFVMK